MPRFRTSSSAEILVHVRRGAGEPLHRQLEHEVRVAIRDGRLRPATVLPSTRVLARELGVARGVVVEAYAQLVAEGYLLATPGSATRVAESARAVSPAPTIPPPADAEPRYDLRPGRPDLDLFPREAWARSVRRVLATAPSRRLGYLEGNGVPELRTALAAYLDRVRGTCAAADDVVITTGFTQGLALVAGVLRGRGLHAVAVEAPGFPGALGVLAGAGLRLVPIPVDEDGMRVDLLAATEAEAVVVTPAHQFPTGAVLSASRRSALLDWAAARGAIVIEDDYDAEFRYDQAPVGALQGLAPDRVIYSGTASKVLAPGLRTGWLVVPRHLAPALADAKRAADAGSPALEQLVLADLIECGNLGRHLRHVRPIYRRRRDALLRALERHLPDLEPAGISAGLHVLAWLPPGLTAPSLLEAAARQGLTAEAVTGAGERDAIVFGYASADERTIAAGIRVLRTVLDGRGRGGIGPERARIGPERVRAGRSSGAGGR